MPTVSVMDCEGSKCGRFSHCEGKYGHTSEHLKFISEDKTRHYACLDFVAVGFFKPPQKKLTLCEIEG